MAWIRNSRPENGNIYYNTSANGGISRCITGNYSDLYVQHWGMNVLRNCVGAAAGAFNETYVYNTPNCPDTFKYPLNSNANRFIELAPSWGLGDYVLPKTSKPPLGGLIVWQNQHVAYICDVTSEFEIKVQQSGYGDGRPAPQFDSNHNEVGSYQWGWREDTYTRTSTSGDWSSRTGGGSHGTCLGYIANPAVPEGSTPDPDEDPADYPPTISSIAQTSATNITISGSVNGVSGITTGGRVYVNYDSSTVSTSNYDSAINVSGNFNINVNKPREAVRVSVLLVQLNNTGTNINSSIQTVTLVASIPCINVYNSNAMKQSIPYVYTGGQWRTCVPYVYTGGQWREIYNNKT